MNATRILIVDDHPMVIEGISVLLKDEPSIQIIGSAISADAALKFLEQQATDVVLLDINLPDQSGIDVCKHIANKYITTRVIAISNHSLPSYIQKIIAYGGSGYLLKNTTKQELLQAIEMAMLGKEYFSREILRSLREQKETNQAVAITRREKEILQLISDGKTNNEIAAQLFISSSTVDTHRKNLIEKLKVNNTAQLVKKATLLKVIE